MVRPEPDSAPATLDAVVRLAARRLREQGLDTPQLDARLLIGHVLGLAHDRLVADPGRVISQGEWLEIGRVLSRRIAGEPVSRIVGYREFWGRRFVLTPETLDPRPETETVVETVLGLVARNAIARAPRLIDVGTGSGCILVTLLAELPEATGVATDISAEALQTARCNAEKLGVADRAAFVVADGLERISGTFDVIVSNPPYIRSSEIDDLAPEVRCHDPRAALDGGRDGLAIYRRIICEASRVAPGGWVVLEVGHDQAGAVLELAAQSGMVVEGTTSTHMDLAGLARCVSWRAQD